MPCVAFGEAATLLQHKLYQDKVLICVLLSVFWY